MKPARDVPAAGPREPGPPAAGSIPWAEFHCHSSFSFLDGASTPDELVAKAARLGLETLAITDHDGMYGVPQFAQAAAPLRDQGIQPGHGVRRRAQLGAAGARPGRPTRRAATC